MFAIGCLGSRSAMAVEYGRSPSVFLSQRRHCRCPAERRMTHRTIVALMRSKSWAACPAYRSSSAVRARNVSRNDSRSVAVSSHTNSTVLCIPTSQRGLGRRTEKSRRSVAIGSRFVRESDGFKPRREIRGQEASVVLDERHASCMTPCSIGYRAIGVVPVFGFGGQRSYLVDPASSHMLVSKIKPCMSKHKLLHSEAANGSLGHPLFLGSYNPTWITVVILELIHASKLRPFGGRARLLDQNQSGLRVRTFGDSG